MNRPDNETDPQARLQSYLDELLITPEPAAVAYAEPDSTDANPQRERLQKLLYSAAAPATKTVIETPAIVDPRPAPEKPQEPPAQFAPEIGAPGIEVPEPEASAPVFRMKDVEWLDNGRPVWAQRRFDVLLFDVSGLTLAVPLVALGQIQPLTDELTPLFGQADWFMGLLPTSTGKVRTVNTAKFVMPERYDEHFLETAQYVVSIDGVPWGLAVDAVNQPISLDPEDVKWRSERSRRPWLAGTVKQHMCALLDIPRMGQLLMDADRKRA